jgi:hypothetical protein
MFDDAGNKLVDERDVQAMESRIGWVAMAKPHATRLGRDSSVLDLMVEDVVRP